MGTQILERFGYIDLLINNAGFGEFGKVENQSIEQIEAVMRTNYFGMVYCTKVFLHSMLSRHSGHIVNVASLAASFGVAGMAGYCASKYAMLGFSESLVSRAIWNWCTHNSSKPYWRENKFLQQSIF